MRYFFLLSFVLTIACGSAAGPTSRAVGGSCTSNGDCNGGVCVDGVCCASAELACAGSSRCGSYQARQNFRRSIATSVPAL